MDNKYLKWLTGNTGTIYWHDSAHRAEMAEAMQNGAVGMTTNPFLCNAVLQAHKDEWTQQIKAVPVDIVGDARSEALICEVTLHYANLLRPLYDGGGFGEGYVCAQVNPQDIANADAMLIQAERIAAWAPNISIKLPATAAGLEVFETCVARGYNVTATVSFTVPQLMAFGAAHQRGVAAARHAGIKPGLAIGVLMVGRLDDYLRDVAHDRRANVSESDIIQAGTACIKRAYALYQEYGYELILMPAGCRGAYHITELAGARMILSVAPKIAGLLGELTGPFEERIHLPVEHAVIDRLLALPEFRKAYEPDGMEPLDFITYGATNRTATQFVECGWNPLQTIAL